MSLPSTEQMENPAFERDGSASAAAAGGPPVVRSVELGAVEATAAVAPGNGAVCTDLCRSRLPPLALQHKPPPSPWNRLKTVFLATIIAILVLWVVVFTTLSQLGYF